MTASQPKRAEVLHDFWKRAIGVCILSRALALRGQTVEVDDDLAKPALGNRMAARAATAILCHNPIIGPS